LDNKSLASINFLSENINHEKYVSKDSKIEGIKINPITYHTEIKINGNVEKFDIKVFKSDKSYTVSLSNTPIRATIARPLHISNTELDLALKEILNNWETLYLYPDLER